MQKLLAAAALVLALCVPADAKRKPGKPGKHGNSGSVAWAQTDVVVIHDYYGRQGLPPGIQKQLVRKGTLPPGIAKKIAPFPPDLDRRLPPLPAGVHRGYYGGAAILYDPVARIIYDVADIVATVRSR